MKTLTLRKPHWLGLRAQVDGLRAAARERSYADRSAAARIAIGEPLIGRRVTLVWIAGSRHVVVPGETIPADVDIDAEATLLALDPRTGAITLGIEC